MCTVCVAEQFLFTFEQLLSLWEISTALVWRGLHYWRSKYDLTFPAKYIINQNFICRALFIHSFTDEKTDRCQPPSPLRNST